MTGAFDQIGALSILIQGPLGPDNAGALLRNCERWRRLFPVAQLVCSISSIDHASEEVRTAEGHLRGICDIVVHAPPTAALPPIKTDSAGPNNVNAMIAAAHEGLPHATGQHLLRVRNDLTFSTRAFLTAYEAGASLPRGSHALFKHRVMIAEVFTLNPLTHSHLPFHFSDWFHFGLASDVRAIWDAVMPVSMSDSSYYSSEPHHPGSNAVERRFLTRLAPEQVVHFPVFDRAFSGLALDRHNDPTSLDVSLSILADNFVLANLAGIGAHLTKYQPVIDSPSSYTRLECLHQAHVKTLALQPGASLAILFRADILATGRYEHSLARVRRWLRRNFFTALRRLRRPAA